MLARADMDTSLACRPGSMSSAAIGDVVSAAFLAHSASVQGVALRSTRDPELAADVTQEAFLRLFVEAQAGRLPDNVGAWLYRTSANLIVTRARRAAVARRHAPSLVRFDGPAQPEAIAILHEDRDELHLALTTLPPAHRVALVMAADGATGVEIARRLGRSHNATRTLLTRARGRLRTAATDAEAPVPA
jgi:RNA polymerase sigma factor (sigma-70 family)